MATKMHLFDFKSTIGRKHFFNENEFLFPKGKVRF